MGVYPRDPMVVVYMNHAMPIYLQESRVQEGGCSAVRQLILLVSRVRLTKHTQQVNGWMKDEEITKVHVDPAKQSISQRWFMLCLLTNPASIIQRVVQRRKIQSCTKRAATFDVRRHLFRRPQVTLLSNLSKPFSTPTRSSRERNIHAASAAAEEEAWPLTLYSWRQCVFVCDERLCPSAARANFSTESTRRVTRLPRLRTPSTHRANSRLKLFSIVKTVCNRLLQLMPICS